MKTKISHNNKVSQFSKPLSPKLAYSILGAVVFLMVGATSYFAYTNGMITPGINLISEERGDVRVRTPLKTTPKPSVKASPKATNKNAKPTSTPKAAVVFTDMRDQEDKLYDDLIQKQVACQKKYLIISEEVVPGFEQNQINFWKCIDDASKVYDQSVRSMRQRMSGMAL